jgi:hypothetical protein
MAITWIARIRHRDFVSDINQHSEREQQRTGCVGSNDDALPRCSDAKLVLIDPQEGLTLRRDAKRIGVAKRLSMDRLNCRTQNLWRSAEIRLADVHVNNAATGEFQPVRMLLSFHDAEGLNCGDAMRNRGLAGVE